MARTISFLIEQPTSVVDLDEGRIDTLVISASMYEDAVVVISRYGDDVWDLRPYFGQSNIPRSMKRISWSSISPGFVTGAKAVLFRYWSIGVPGRTRPGARSVISAFSGLKVFFSWLATRGVQRISDIRTLHVSAFIADCRERNVSPKALFAFCRAIELLHILREYSPDPFGCEPWPGTNATTVAGLNGPTTLAQLSTQIIPDKVLQVLFQYAERQIAGARDHLDERDQGQREPFRDPQLLRIRDAAFFLIGVTSGMRCEELVGVEVDAVRDEQRDGLTVHWLRSIEHKSARGESEWIVPDIAVTCVRILERWSRPFRERIALEANRLREELDTETDPAARASLLCRLGELKADHNRLFLGSSRGDVLAMSANAWRRRMEAFVKEAGVDWKLSPHQLRRTFVVACAHHALGDLVYLKEQLKHHSLDMTAMYACNPKQDESLIDEVLESIRAFKVGVIEHWLNPEALITGAAAETIRANRVDGIASRRALAEDTADKIAIRATGHGWCLAQDDGCGGQGLWEKTRCVECSNGLMDERHIAVWRGIYDQQCELLDISDELGPGAARRVVRDLERAERVLRSLGVPLDEGKVSHGQGSRCDDK